MWAWARFLPRRRCSRKPELFTRRLLIRSMAVRWLNTLLHSALYSGRAQLIQETWFQSIRKIRPLRLSSVQHRYWQEHSGGCPSPPALGMVDGASDTSGLP